MEKRKRKRVVYHVVETSIVTDEELERIINEEVEKGWTLESIQFAVKESARRPAMAFILFTREVTEEDEES